MSGKREISDSVYEQIVRLRDEEEMSWAQIAQQLNVKKQSVRTVYMRGRRLPQRTPAPGELLPEILGVGPDSDLVPPDQLWDKVISAQKSIVRKLTDRRREQRIVMPEPDKPFAIAHLSDIHIGDACTDYAAVKRDAEIVRDTPGMYAGFHGDATNNWIGAKLAWLQRGEIIPFDEEMQLFAAWLSILSGKLLTVVSGNHDNWTRLLAGVDRIRDLVRGTMVLCDRHEIVYDLVHGVNVYVVKIRHKWKYGSVFNDTHGIEVGYDRGG